MGKTVGTDKTSNAQKDEIENLICNDKQLFKDALCLGFVARGLAIFPANPLQ